jgi:hypothetical protein
MAVAARAPSRKVKAEIAAEAQAPVRTAERAPAREQRITGYVDREGNPLTRKNPSYRNEFDFKEGEVPEGWAYQWIRLTVHGDPEHSEIFDMMENAWRPVPHSRHAGRFAPYFLEGTDKSNAKNACIVRRGQLLVERPIGLNEEALAEQKREANSQVNTQFGSLNVPLPDNVRGMGLEARPGIARRQTNDIGQVRSDFMPKHQLAIDQ